MHAGRACGHASRCRIFEILIDTHPMHPGTLRRRSELTQVGHDRQRHTQPTHIVLSLSSRVSRISVLDVVYEPLVSSTCIYFLRHVQCMPQFWARARPCICWSVRNGQCSGMSVPIYIHTPSRHPAQMSMLDNVHQGAIFTTAWKTYLCAVHIHPHQVALGCAISCCTFFSRLMGLKHAHSRRSHPLLVSDYVYP